MKVKTIIKASGVILLLAVIVFVCVYFYWSRSQTIDFTKELKSEVSVCGDQIGVNDYRFENLQNWLRNNKDGWVTYLATQAPGYMYRSKNISINVSSGFVVINYKNKNGYAQVSKKADTTSINGVCKNDS